MSDVAAKALRFPVLAAVVLLLTGQAPAPAPLQQVANDAALAAAQVLAVGGPMQDARAAAEQKIASIPGAVAKVTASSAEAAVTVEVAAKPASVTGIARYQAADQPAHFAWASRQHFAVNTSPVVIGSTCRSNCDDIR